MPAPLNRPITRVIEFRDRGKRVVIRITPSGILMKQEGQRWTSAVECSWGAAFSTACKLAVQRERAERKAKRTAAS